MLSLQTRDNWSTLSVSVKVGAPAAEVWTCDRTENSAFDALVSFVTWCNAAGRSWTGLVLFDWTWQRDATTGGAIVSVRASGATMNLTPNDFYALLSLAAVVGATTSTGTTAAAGTWSPAPAGKLPLRLGVRWLREPGEASGVGAIRPGIPGLAAPWYTCRPVVGAVDCARWTDVVRWASHPRRAWLRLSNVARVSEWVVSPGDDDGFALLAVGQVQRQRQGASLWSFDLRLAGDAV